MSVLVYKDTSEGELFIQKIKCSFYINVIYYNIISSKFLSYFVKYFCKKA